MKTLIYTPQENATPDEVMQVLKVFTVATLPDGIRTSEAMFQVYDSLPKTAQRHFKIHDHK